MPSRERKPVAYAKQQRKKGTLTKDEIVQCAFNLIANKGTEGCSMRALGNELGVSAMALYGYIPSRESLLNEVVERFLKTVDTRALRGERWEDTLIRTTLSLRRAFVSSPHFAELMCDPCVGRGIEPYMLELRLIYLGQGMPEDIAVQLIAITDSYLTGFALRARQNLRIEQAEAARKQAEADASRFATTSRVPGMLTGKANPAAEQPRFNERWRQTVAEGYSETSFQKGLLVIIEGIRAGMAGRPANWQTPQ